GAGASYAGPALPDQPECPLSVCGPPSPPSLSPREPFSARGTRTCPLGRFPCFPDLARRGAERLTIYLASLPASTAFECSPWPQFRRRSRLCGSARRWDPDRSRTVRRRLAGRGGGRLATI